MKVSRANPPRGAWWANTRWVTHAKARGLVRLPDARLARLVYVAPDGQRARVRLRPDLPAFTVRLGDLELVTGEDTLPPRSRQARQFRRWKRYPRRRYPASPKRPGGCAYCNRNATWIVLYDAPKPACGIHAADDGAAHRLVPHEAVYAPTLAAQVAAVLDGAGEGGDRG